MDALLDQTAMSHTYYLFNETQENSNGIFPYVCCQEIIHWCK